jgi:type IV pilus assembly protein PilC
MTKAAHKTTSAPHHIHVRGKEREFFTSNLALLLRAAVPVGDALQSLKDASKSKPLQKAITLMQRDIDEGMSLGKALARSHVVSAQTLALVSLGEQSGNLAENLAVAAKQEEKQRSFQSKVRSALIYPTFVISLTLLVGIGVAWFLLPRLAATFAQLDIQLPFISQVFINFGIFLQNNGLWAIPLFIGGSALVGYILFGMRATRGAGQWILFHIPGVSGLLHEIEIARFGYLLGTLLQAGLTITEALTLLRNATTVAPYRKLYDYLRAKFENGYSFRTSFAEYRHAHKLLPPAVQQMVIAGERSGALPETLQNIGTIYEGKADVSTQNLESVLEPILLVIVWLGVMGVAVAVILPIYSLVGGLGT